MAQRRARRPRRAVGLAITLAVVGLVIVVTRDPADEAWLDGHTYGDWRAVYNGYGATTSTWRSDTQTIRLHPEAAQRAEETHAGLVVSTSTVADGTLTARLTTVQQLRAAPNPWEVGWLLWRFTDPDHFYAVALKPNGWELSKQDPTYPGRQRFLASGSVPTFDIGRPRDVTVVFRGDRFDVEVDGVHLASYRDTRSPYLTGSVGLYSEDAVVDFSQIVVSPDPAG